MYKKWDRQKEKTMWKEKKLLCKVFGIWYNS